MGKISKKGDMVTNAILTLVISIIIVFFVINFFGNFIHFGVNFANDEMAKMDEAIKTVKSDSSVFAKPVFIKLGDYRSIFLAKPGYDKVKITYAPGGGINNIVSLSKTFEITVPPICDKTKTCICYCDKTEIGDAGYLECLPGKTVCKNYAFDIEVSEDDFFDKKPISLKFDGGFLISRTFEDLGVVYRNKFIIQEQGTKLYICMKKEGGLCIDP